MQRFRVHPAPLRRVALGLLRLVARLACVGLGVCTLLGFASSWSWLADLFAHFRAQYLWCLLPLGAYFVGTRSPRWAGATGLLLLANGVTVAPRYLANPVAAAAESSTPPVRALLFNVNTHHGDSVQVRRLIRHEKADVLVLLEVSSRWIRELGPALVDYPHRQIAPRNDNFGVALFSKSPLSGSRTLSLGSRDLPSVVATLTTPGGNITVLGTHPLPPVSRSDSEGRNDQLVALAEFAAELPGPVLLLGDLNVTPFSEHFDRLLVGSGLLDSGRGFGVQATWPMDNPLLRIPIDHCLHSPAIRIVDRRVLAGAGSDHFPVVVDFTL